MIRICCDYRNGTGCMAENPADANHCGACGRPLHFALPAYAAGERVGRYLVQRRIGQGGFGAVYAAIDPQRPAEPLALKMSFDPDAVEGLAHEFALLRELRHDHLPRYLDMFTLGDYGHLVMELIPGQSLEEVLAARGRPLPEAQVLGYAVQLCQVLADLHGHTPPLIHRDIKPANIRITPDGRIVLVDFGLVKRGGDRTVQSLKGVGTIQYAPFEQFGHGTTDERSDQYSLAATLYHLITGQEPASVPERIAASDDSLLPPDQVNPAVSAQVSRALMRGLALRAADRWPSVAQLGAALLGRVEPPAAPAAPPPSSTLPWQRPSPSPAPPTSGLPWPGSPAAPAGDPKPAGLPWPGQDPRDAGEKTSNG